MTDTDWHGPTAHFTVEISGVGAKLSFLEVSGLDLQSPPVEYRAGSAPSFSTIKLPGLRKFGNVTLKRGVFRKDSRLIDWLGSVRRNTTTRSTVTITLLDENGQPAMRWTLANARPTKISGPDLNADGNEVAVETLELAHEGLTIDTK